MTLSVEPVFRPGLSEGLGLDVLADLKAYVQQYYNTAVKDIQAKVRAEVLAQIPTIRAEVTKEVLKNVPEIRKQVESAAAGAVKPYLFVAYALGGLGLLAGGYALYRARKKKA